MEVNDCGSSVALGSPKQRATLGFLLLHANTVVPTSKLLKALWGEEAPPTARKMLQNAVCGIRAILADERNDAEAPAALLTHAPGYLLRIDTNSIDLFRFQALAEDGRADLAAGSWESAARKLREALSLWRGPALADLVEAGIAWPELTAVQNGRIAALEDLVEAELACGRHHEAVAELEAMVAAEPLRERLCGQLMRALYRDGRQAEAVSVYRRTRTLLRERLGIEPGHELRDLHRAILDHDPALQHPATERIVIPQQQQPRVEARPAAAERKWITALLVATETDEDDIEDADRNLKDVLGAVRDEVARFGGIVTASAGPMALAVFGVPLTREDDASRALMAATAIRDRFPSVRIAVATGETFVRPRGGPPLITGEALNTGLRLLTAAEPGAIEQCDVTRDITGRVPGRAPLIDRDRELKLLRELVEHTARTNTAHLVTLVGEPGMGKTRLVTELAGAQFLTTPHIPDTARVVVFEDLHLADDALIDFVHRIPQRSGPLLVVATARPELRWSRPSWGGGPRHTTITLGPLSEIGTSRLLDALLDGADSRLVRSNPALLTRIGGNPLFAEEYVRALGTHSAALPNTLRAVVAARLDAAPAEEKTVLQNAAVLGETVWPGAVAAISGLERAEVKKILDRWERRDIVRRRPASTIPGETEYAFRHQLVLDVAHDQLPRAVRADKHRLAAAWLEQQPAVKADMLACHFGHAVRLSAAAGKPTEELRERARTVLADAGRRAAALGAYAIAVRCYRTAIELAPEDDPNRASLLRLYRKSLAHCDPDQVFISVGDVAPRVLVRA
ncbi:BTAD domain-containing putative transcriptional regulator [Lentzea sp. NBRC 105346]|uniref:BTAD domain-containing putative transcriptional regulator n=1 Tax=Lentzea sp. NBRC 105346 TaxID=3032205 RepID=UPI002556E5A8|nr:BTAD domain-containing putative transcriptional regulator [Lentzea sp. NBRC 105346]